MKRVPTLLARAHRLPACSSPFPNCSFSSSLSSVCTSSFPSLLSAPRTRTTTTLSAPGIGIFKFHFYSSLKPSIFKSNVYNNFQTGAASIPHPSKVTKGGEDAHFISSDYRVIAVADGVGGWSDVGVDPALYSRALMEGCKLYCAENLINIQPDSVKTIYEPVSIMTAGYNFASKIIGSSTCCVCVLDGLQLRVANIGDSGFTIVRKGKVLYNSQPQQHAFNFPFQLGAESADLPEHAELFEKTLEMGDIVIAATDGVFDNVSAEVIAALVSKDTKDSSNSHKSMATILADKIARHARVQAEKRTGDSPFALMAQNYGYDFKGGKLDDITVVVGIVSECETEE